MTFGPGRHVRGNWAARTDEVAKEVNDIQVFQLRDTPTPTHSEVDADRVIALIAGHQPVTRLDADLIAPATFSLGEAVTVSVEAGELNHVQLHYRHVNQGERWKSTPMSRTIGGYSATIAGEYSLSNDHLQVYVTAHRAGRVHVAPGFPHQLAGAPYLLIAQRT